MATEVLSVEKKVGISSVIPVIRSLRAMLEKQTPTTSKGKALLRSANAAIEDRLRTQYERNIICATATVMDPRFKHHALTVPAMLPQVTEAIKKVLSTMRVPVVQASPVVVSTENRDPNANFWAEIDDNYHRLAATGAETDTGVVAFNHYNRDTPISRLDCPLLYWNDRKSSRLYPVAMDAQLPMATSVPSERVASRINYIIFTYILFFNDARSEPDLPNALL